MNSQSTCWVSDPLPPVKSTYRAPDESSDVETEDLYADMPELQDVSDSEDEDDEPTPIKSAPKPDPDPKANTTSATTSVSQSGGAESSSVTKEEREAVPEISPQFWEWKRSIIALKKKVEKGPQWSDADAQQLFGDLGLLQWWYDIQAEEEAGREPDWELWKAKIFDEWKKRYPEVSSKDLETVADDFQGPDLRPANPIENDGTDDVEMIDEDNTPGNPPPTPEKSPLGPYPTNLPIEDPPMQQTLDVQDIAELKSRIGELEEQIAKVERGMRWKLKNLGMQVFHDGITLTDLKWKLAEVKGRGKKTKGKGKRAYKKARLRGASHRYPTRYSGGTERTDPEASEGGLEKLEERVKTLEVRQDEMVVEKKKIEDDLAHVEDLAPKVNSLQRSLEEFKTSQLKVNMSIVQELVALKAAYHETLEKKTAAHATDIAILAARFNVLQTIASNIITARAQPFAPSPPQTHEPKPFYPPSFPYGKNLPSQLNPIRRPPPVQV